jgi:hypothetical protein
MTAASARIRLRALIGILVTSIAFQTGISRAATVAIPAQLSMGGVQGPIPQARTPQTPPASPAKHQAGLTPEEQRQFAHEMKHLKPKERRRLTKAIKEFTPEERSQFIEALKRQLAANRTAPHQPIKRAM